MSFTQGISPEITAAGIPPVEADVIVVGAGPAGSTAAYHLAASGLDVALVEKSAFPRDKVCGDGFTPRAVRSLAAMGIDTSEQAGWLHNKGLRIHGGGHTIELDWPELASYPGYGLVRPRLDFDDLMARHAVKAGAVLYEQCAVTGPEFDDRTGRISGVVAKPVDERGRRAGADRSFRAPIVLACDGNSTRLSIAMGLHKRDDRPMGVAYRTYYTSPRTNDDYLESWLELWDGPPNASNLLPGYGWIFGMGDGTSNVGLGILNTSKAFGHVDYPDLLKRWLEHTPADWGFREENRTQPIRGAALPMGFNRTPAYDRGLLLLGDAAGMINPFNGEGIAYAMESAQLAAEVIVQSRSRVGADRERVLASYPSVLRQHLGGYYRLGGIFVKIIGNPGLMRRLTKYGLPHTRTMKLALKLMANLTDPRDGDAMDRLINAAVRIAPAVGK